MTPELRAFFDDKVRQYGSAWGGGVSALERVFHLTGEKKWREKRLALVTRDSVGVRYKLRVTSNGSMFTEGPLWPEAPSLDAATTERINAWLQHERVLWLVEPLNGLVMRMNVERGVEALTVAREEDVMSPASVQTRGLGDEAVYYLSNIWPGDVWCLVFAANTGALLRAVHVGLPPDEKGWLLTESDRTFFDTALKRYGDFGVYGDVTCGFEELATSFEVKIARHEERYGFHVEPKDGHGHFLYFDMDRATGFIGGCVAGH